MQSPVVASVPKKHRKKREIFIFLALDITGYQPEVIRKIPLISHAFSHKKRMILDGILDSLRLNADVALCGGGAAVLQ